jgi:hypothetical protein
VNDTCRAKNVAYKNIITGKHKVNSYAFSYVKVCLFVCYSTLSTLFIQILYKSLLMTVGDLKVIDSGNPGLM